jgi:hypothetical protein
MFRDIPEGELLGENSLGALGGGASADEIDRMDWHLWKPIKHRGGCIKYQSSRHIWAVPRRPWLSDDEHSGHTDGSYTFRYNVL